MVVGIPHDLKLDFLVALHGLFHQHLVHGRQGEGVQADFFQLRLVVGEAAAGAAQGEGGPEHHRVADPGSRRLGLLNGVGDFRGNDRFADGLA